MKVTHFEDLESPRVAVAHEAKNSTDVISKNDLHEVSAVYESATLEDLFVLLETIFVGQLRRLLVRVVLVDGKNLLSDKLKKGQNVRMG